MIVTDTRRLSKACNKVNLKEGLDIIRKLELELADSSMSGIGLAANQIGLLKNVCILRIPNDDLVNPAIFGYNLINPKIVDKKYPIIVKNEGCLSYPGQTVSTLRYDNIVVEDLLEPAGRHLTGWASICCQHEVDHLNGLTMFDRKFTNMKNTSQCPCDSGKIFKKCCMRKINK